MWCAENQEALEMRAGIYLTSWAGGNPEQGQQGHVWAVFEDVLGRSAGRMFPHTTTEYQDLHACHGNGGGKEGGCY